MFGSLRRLCRDAGKQNGQKEHAHDSIPANTPDIQDQDHNHTLLSFIEENLRAVFSCHDDVDVAVGIQIGRAYLQAAADLPFVDRITLEGLLLRVPHVVAHDGRFRGTGIVAIVRADPLASDQLLGSVPVQIGQAEAMGLGEGIVDQMLLKL
jgi:hypothetical protein